MIMITVNTPDDIPADAKMIVHRSATEIDIFFETDPEYDAEFIEPFRRERKIILKNKCKLLIEAGFTSSALGADHHYNSELENQTNLILAATRNTSVNYKCVDANNVKVPRLHTPQQINQVINDFESHRQARIDELEVFTGLIDVATTQAEIKGVGW